MKKLLMMAVFMGGAAMAGTLEEGKMALEKHDYAKAAERFGTSCTDGNPQGCFELGALYEKGVGIAQDPYRAADLYAQACRGGEAKGCSHMGGNVAY